MFSNTTVMKKKAWKTLATLQKRNIEFNYYVKEYITHTRNAQQS